MNGSQIENSALLRAMFFCMLEDEQLKPEKQQQKKEIVKH